MATQRIKFNEDRDLALLRQSIGSQVYGLPNGTGWKQVASALGETDLFPEHITARACRDRCAYLITAYKQRDQENRSSSGIDEDYGEKEQLLEELLGMKREAESQAAAPTAKTSDKDAGAAVREQAMEGLTATQGEQDPAEEDNSPNPPKKAKKRTSNQAIMDYLEAKEKNRREEREAELALRKEELDKKYEVRQAELELRREEQRQQAEERKAWLDVLKNLMPSNK